MPSSQPPQQIARGSNDIDISDIGRTLSRQWRRIAKITAYATLLAIIFVLFSRPQFTIKGSLYLGDAQTGSGAAQEAADSSGLGFLSGFESVSDVETQIELIQADALLQKAILETGMNSPMMAQDSPDLRFWNWRFLYGKQIDAFAPRPGDAVALFATLARPVQNAVTFQVVMGQDGTYQILQPGHWGSSPTPILTGRLGQPAAGGGLSLLIQPASKQYPPLPGAVFILKVQPAGVMSDALIKKGVLSVTAGGTVTEPTKVAFLTLQWSDPYQGKIFIDQVMKDFIATQLSWKTESASITESFISTQLDNIRESLSSADKNLADYQAKTGILDVPATATAVITQLSQYEVQRTTLVLQQEALQQLASDIAHAGATGGDPYLISQSSLNPYLVSQTGDLVLGQLASGLASAEVQLQAQRVQFGPGSTEIKTQEATIAKTQDAIRTLVGNDLALAGTNLQDDNAQISAFETQLKAMPAQGLQIVELTRSSDVFGQLFVLLMQKDEEAEVSKAATIIDTRVVSPAQLPFTSTKPQASVTTLMGLFLGLFFASGLVLVKREISGKYQTDDEIRRAISLPVYGMVPKRTRGESSAGIFSTRPQSPFSEAFRLLRSNLYQSAAAQASRVILITSASSADGKTTVAANLAKFLADDGRRVVLVDGDLHLGRVHQALKLDQSPGLAEWLVAKQRPKLQLPAEQRFLVLTAGLFPPNPSELVNEPTLADVFAALREDFEFIIVDCPPLPAVADTMSLGQHADLTLSVVFIEHTARRMFDSHVETINTLDRRHGLIINGVIGSVYGYGYGYGYGYAGRDGERRRTTLAGKLGQIWDAVF